MKFFLNLIFFLTLSSNLFAGIEKFFTLPEAKTSNHSMKNIDFIYMINLDERPEKYEIARQEIEPHGIFPLRFSAINGWKLSPMDLLELGIKFDQNMTGGIWGTYYPLDGGVPLHEIMYASGKVYFSHCMAKGAIGCVLSHCSILEDAYQSGYETIWIMEDDIQVLKDPHMLSELITKLDENTGRNWDVLFTDPDTKNNNGEYVPCRAYAHYPNFAPSNPARFLKEKIMDHNFKKIGARYGSYSMIIRRSGIKKILNFIKSHKIFLPYDMTYTLPNDINLYGLNYDVVSHTPNSISDNGAPPDRPK